MVRGMKYCLAAAVLSAGFSYASASAAVIAQHIGNIDPLTEAVSGSNSTNWAAFPDTGPGTGVSVQGQAGPPPSWTVNDASTAGGSNFRYRYLPTTEERDAMRTDGWKLTIEVRINNLSQSADHQSSTVTYADTGGTGYLGVRFGSDANGNPVINYASAGKQTLNIGAGFHTYEFVYTPSDSKVHLYVDGTETSSSALSTTSLNYFDWGSGESGSTGSASYAVVKLETLPEPASLSLLSLGALGLLRRRRRHA